MSQNERDRLTLIIENLKWLIGTAGLVWATFIIDAGLRTRTLEIQEMQAYDKYVEVILKAGNIEQRWKLSEYFSTVTPSDRLRERWIAYKDLIEDDYNEFIELQNEERALVAKQRTRRTRPPKTLNASSTLEQEKELEDIEEELQEVRSRISRYDRELFKTRQRSQEDNKEK